MNLIVFRRRAERAQMVGRGTWLHRVRHPGGRSEIAGVHFCTCIGHHLIIRAILAGGEFNLHLQPIKKGSSYDQNEAILDANMMELYKGTNAKIGVNERQSMPPYKLQDGFQFLESCFDGVHTFLLLPLNSSTECLNQKLKAGSFKKNKEHSIYQKVTSHGEFVV